MNSVCLINPPCPWLLNDRSHHPMGILALAAYLRQYHIDVTVLDLASEDVETVDFPAADVYGVTGVTAQMPLVARIAERLAGERHASLRVIGGIHATVLPEETLSQTDFGVAVVGEGEKTLLEIATGRPLARIDGIVWKNSQGGITVNPPRRLLESLDDLPIPAFDMIDMPSYRPAGIADAVTVITARGCPYSCLFCSAVPREYRRYRQRSLDKVVAEIRYLQETYDTSVISFQDELFTLDKDRFVDACRRFADMGIRWRFMTRSDAVDSEMIRAAIEGGCFEMCLGIESGSQKILDILNKRTTVQNNADALDLARKEGLRTMAYLISASPGEDDATVDETIEFIRDHPADEYGLMLFTPFPGTEVWREPEKYGFVLPDDYNQYQYLNRDGTGVSLHQDPDTALRLHARLFECIKDASSFARKDRVVA